MLLRAEVASNRPRSTRFRFELFRWCPGGVKRERSNIGRDSEVNTGWLLSRARVRSATEHLLCPEVVIEIYTETVSVVNSDPR